MGFSAKKILKVITFQAAPDDGRLKRYCEVMSHGADIVAVTLLIVLFFSVMGMIIGRTFLNVGLPWLDDLARYLQIWFVYAAAVSLTMKGDHVTMDALYLRFPAAGRRVIKVFNGILSLIFCAITAYLAIQQALEVIAFNEVSSSGVLPAIIGYASLPFGFGLMVIASVYYIYHGSRFG